MAGDLHPLTQVKTVRAIAPHTRIKLQLRAALHPRVRHQPVEKLPAVALGPVFLAGRQIVYVEEPAAESFSLTRKPATARTNSPDSKKTNR